MDDTRRLAEAFAFAAEKHADQRRKGARATPYIVHPAEVARLLAVHTNGTDTNLVIAGILHDTVEDTNTTQAEIRDTFGKDVADLVAAVSDDKSLPKDKRKQLQIEHAAHGTDRVKMLKMADKIANLASLLEDPPTGWDKTRIDGYFNWAKQVVDKCRGVNAGLERDFDRAYRARFPRL